MKNRNNIDFVARHYRQGAFNPRVQWKRLGLVTRPTLFFKVAASLGAVVALSAAAVGFYKVFAPHVENNPLPAPVSDGDPVSSMVTVREIDCDDAPLTEVIQRTEQIYNVKVINMPESRGDYRLTLHFTGDITELIETINEILGTELAIEK